MQPLEVADGLLVEGVLGELVACRVGEGVPEEEGFGLAVGEEIVVVLYFGGVEGGPLAGNVEVDFLEFEVVLLNGGWITKLQLMSLSLRSSRFESWGHSSSSRGPELSSFFWRLR